MSEVFKWVTLQCWLDPEPGAIGYCRNTYSNSSPILEHERVEAFFHRTSLRFVAVGHIVKSPKASGLFLPPPPSPLPLPY